MSSGKWAEPGVPHKGWVLVDSFDNGGGDHLDTCQMCEAREIRYVHVMEHPAYDGQIRAGRHCGTAMAVEYAGKIEDAERALVRKARSEAERKRRAKERAERQRRADEWSARQAAVKPYPAPEPADRPQPAMRPMFQAALEALRAPIFKWEEQRERFIEEHGSEAVNVFETMFPRPANPPSPSGALVKSAVK